MDKKTIIANVRAELTLNEELQAFLEQFSDREDAWFARDGGSALLEEFGFEWNTNFIEVAQSVFDRYFQHFGIPEGRLPQLELTDSRRGSWIIEAALVMYGTIGTTYSILKGVAELPKLADGLEETKERLTKELFSRFKKKVPERIEPVLSNAGILGLLPPPVRATPVSVSCSIDARPIRGLTPDVAKSHSIHLAVAVSRSALSVENLGDSSIENLRIGLFKSSTQKSQWSFSDAFSKSIPRLGGKQSTSLSVDQFLSGSGGLPLDLSDNNSLYVDCWLQDNSGIYLFNFFLE